MSIYLIMYIVFFYKTIFAVKANVNAVGKVKEKNKLFLELEKS